MSIFFFGIDCFIFLIIIFSFGLVKIRTRPIISTTATIASDKYVCCVIVSCIGQKFVWVEHDVLTISFSALLKRKIITIMTVEIPRIR